MYKVTIIYSDYDPNDLALKEKEFMINPDTQYKVIDDFVNLQVRSKYIPGFHLVNTVTTKFIDDVTILNLTSSLDDSYSLQDNLMSYLSRKASEKHMKK